MSRIFILRLRNSVSVVLEIKGKQHEDTAKHHAARGWVSAVNHWGRLGEWGFWFAVSRTHLVRGRRCEVLDILFQNLLTGGRSIAKC